MRMTKMKLNIMKDTEILPICQKGNPKFLPIKMKQIKNQFALMCHTLHFVTLPSYFHALSPNLLMSYAKRLLSNRNMNRYMKCASYEISLNESMNRYVLKFQRYVRK